MAVNRALPTLLLALVMTFALVWGAAAQNDPQEPEVPVTVVMSSSGVPAGGSIDIAYILNVPADHHVTDRSYGLLYFEPTLPEGMTVTETTWPTGPTEKGEEVYRGDVATIITVTVDETVAPLTYGIPFEYGYQICRDLEPEKCYLPNGGSGTLTLDVLDAESTPMPSRHPIFGGSEMEEGNGGAVLPSAGEASGGALEDRLTSALESGSVWAFLIVFLAGILISFTPCVYPMIPIIIGFVGGSAGGSKAKGFVLSLFFVLGLAVVYAVLGVIAGATGALFGAFMQNPIVLWFIVAVFVALGASMLGAFDITVPSAVQDKMMSGERSGVIGAILIGGVTGIVAAPCAGPPLLVLLSWIGNTGNLVLGFFLMATFAVGIGVLFIVIGTISGAMTALPAAGAWMDKVKKGLGIVIMAVALYYLNLLLSRPLFELVMGAALVFLGIYVGGTRRDDGLTGWQVLGKGLGMISLVAGIFYLLLGLAGINHVNLSGGVAAGGAGGNAAQMTAAEENHVPWRVNDYDAVMADASAEGKPVLIDFYADWCGVCVELDHKVWNQDEVISAVDGTYIPLKLDYTRSTDELENLRKKHGVGGLPTVLILGPEGKERARFNTFKGPDAVIRWLAEHAG